ncbi:hypothetical protein DFH07DRAFT_743017 [Mycena maculata]|uniref:Letm1 RBD domain-containing protein n=1 Tax=Mycena maculata TaxID=230809 RepID=A0AAD7J437_9AGAR|nr:hypothetical protein DFH07DRAFT_743017 [Mycena maculata]
MIRSRVCSHLANAYPVARGPALVLTRRVQTQPSPNSPSKNPIPPPNEHRKPHVQLRPAPIKPPKTKPNPQPTPPPPPVVQTVEPISLTSLKETTVRDISDAENHGILTPPPPGAGWARSTLHKILQLGKFYFRGTKLVYTRSKIARDIRKRIQANGAPLERWEHRMLHTQSADMKRLVPFVLIALVLEEIIPLIVLYAPGMLPSTCILPSQHERIQDKAIDKALMLTTNHGPALKDLTRAANGGEIPLNSLTGEVPMVLCGLLRLSTSGFDSLRIRRIRRHLTFIEQDDALLMKEGLQGLSSQDLVQALYERGVVTRGLGSTEQLKLLKWWLKSVEERENPLARRVYLVAHLGATQ